MRGKEAYHCALLASKSKLAALVSGSGGIRAMPNPDDVSHFTRFGASRRV